MEKILLELTRDQYAKIQAEAWRLGVSVQQFVREAVLSRIPYPGMDRPEKVAPAKPAARQ